MNTLNDNTIAIVDDHLLFASSLEKLINSFQGFRVLFKAQHGLDLIDKLQNLNDLPDIILLDINMPVMNGFETLKWLTENHPTIRVLSLSMDDNEMYILKMLKEGAKGYFLKDIHPKTLEKALLEVMERGFYYSELVTNAMVNSLHSDLPDLDPEFNKNELQFIKLACSELTYKEIADKMKLSPKTVDGYRQDIFKKLGLRNRVGLVMYALKNKMINI
ncbi:response regulator transcription factor [Aureisphaera sp. CAU 1614]|uniref:Response regulator transcription factor n=1 Tax=Halomarinibacterium sedimenti TaxID=2857106 RepID=A0A9X1JX58_9FLAO|nr:response regulator transcription factor [Halomarinibacterium sedimenti]MBW2937773.1 response regulator transcription factor [Halomarinibacterium sedimenti]